MTALITPPRREGTVKVSSRRRIAYSEFGVEDGRAIVWMHGTPGGPRQIPEPARRIALERGLRIIGIARPGIGVSTPHLYDSFLDATGDVRTVLDELGVERFLVIGLSGGGPYALATAYAMPERVVAAGILGGVVPTRGDDAVPGGLVALATRFAPLLAFFHLPLSLVLSGFVWGVRPFGSQALAVYAHFSPEGDQRVFARPEMKAMFLDDIMTGSRRGIRAPVLDAILFTRDWGFRVGDITVPVRWWHGDADNIVPLAHGEAVVPKLRDGELYVRPGESHLGGLGAAEEVIDRLLALWP